MLSLQPLTYTYINRWLAKNKNFKHLSFPKPALLPAFLIDMLSFITWILVIQVNARD